MDNCFLCETKQADTTFKVSLQKVTQSGATKYFQYRSVEVPVCAACKALELKAIQSNAGLALGMLVVLAVIGAIAGGWGGFAGGAMLGFVVFLIVGATKKTSKLTQHPDVKAQEPDGFRVNYP